MTLHQKLSGLQAFELTGTIFYQRNIPRSSDFESKYIALREKEGRLYSDEQLKKLPDFHGKPELQLEWRKRQASTHRLVNYLRQKKKELTILELGCGNGWLSNQLAVLLPAAQVLALDLNEAELQQGARVFNKENLNFLYADIFSAELKAIQFDVIILASAIQYFPDLMRLITHLQMLLKPAGEIHMLDSPLYQAAPERENARTRSEKYFKKMEFEEITEFYFHHLWADVQNFHLKVLHNPKSLASRIKNRLVPNQSPFPHIIIRKP